MRKNVIIAVLAIAVLVLGIWSFDTNQEKTRYKNLVTGNYEDSFVSLQEALKNMDSSLSKALVASNDSYLRNTLLDVWRYSIQGSAAAVNLPVSHVALRETCEVLNQAGDYCFYAAKKLDNESSLTEEESENISKIKDSVYTIRKNVEALAETIRSGDISLLRTDKNKDYYYDGESKYGTDTAFKAIDKMNMEYPKLIYDGPFSEGLKDQKPKMDMGEKINEEQAKKIVDKFLTNIKNIEKIEDSDGIIPCYVYQTKATKESSNDENMYYSIKVSKAGGHVIEIIANREIKEKKLTVNDAVAKAKQFLEKNGLKNMSENYYETYNNKTVINFAYVQNDVVIYPDLIKVQVALDNGEIVGYESSGYYMMHHDRQIPAPAISMAQAQSKVSSRIEITSKKLAIIPTDGGNEILCYEFKGKTKDDEWFIVYINAKTGQQQQILQVIKGDESVLTL